MAEILHQLMLVVSLSHYLQGFIHPRCCRISAINSIIRNLPEGLSYSVVSRSLGKIRSGPQQKRQGLFLGCPGIISDHLDSMELREREDILKFLVEASGDFCGIPPMPPLRGWLG